MQRLIENFAEYQRTLRHRPFVGNHDGAIHKLSVFQWEDDLSYLLRKNLVLSGIID